VMHAQLHGGRRQPLSRARSGGRCRLGSGLQPAIVRALSRACSASVMPGNNRRNVSVN
jgi:hypothetical protein